MTRKEAHNMIGERIGNEPRITWDNIDDRINPLSVVLERIGAHGIAVITYRLTHETDRLWLNKRYTTFENIRGLRVQPTRMEQGQ